jgi:hypothetical protein
MKHLRNNLKVKDLIRYTKTNTRLDLSFPQIIVLYGKLWEKELFPKQLQEVEEYAK